MGLKSKTIPIKKDVYDEAVKEAAKPRESDLMGTIKKIDKVLNIKGEPKVEPFPEPEDDGLDGRQKFKKWTYKELAKERILKENPRLNKLPHLLEIFTEILFYRWVGKEKKTGYVQATINQISVGIQLTEQEAQDVMLGDNTL